MDEFLEEAINMIIKEGKLDTLHKVLEQTKDGMLNEDYQKYSNYLKTAKIYSCEKVN